MLVGLKTLKIKLKDIVPNRVKDALQKIKSVFCDSYYTKSYSLEGEDMILNGFFNTQKDGFYVDIGAHHPKLYSNTFFFYKKGWRGINIDAMPGSMRSFKRSRRRDINLENPVATTKGEMTYYSFNEPALNTFSKELAHQMESLPNYHLLKSEKLETMPLSEILDAHLPAGQKIDFMSIDVEGLDLEVLRSNSWSKYSPKVILIEQLDFSIDSIDADEIFAYLKGHQYKFFARTCSTTFFVKD